MPLNTLSKLIPNLFSNPATKLLAALCPLMLSATLHSAEYRWLPNEALITPIDFTYVPLLPPASNAHKRECVGENYIHNGYLTVDATNEIDAVRCIRWVKSAGFSAGSFKLKAVDNRFHQVGFPYLTWVNNDLLIDGEQDLDEAYFPRLSWVGGSVILDLRSSVEYVGTPALTKAKNLKVYFRSNNVDLNGQNALISLDSLILENGINDNNILLNGLANLTTLKSYQVKGGSVLNPAANTDPNDGGFLESLTTVDGNVSIYTQNMFQLYGLGNINTINGNLIIRNLNGNSTNLQNLQGMEKITTINGQLKIQTIDTLQTLTGVGSITVNSLSIIDNPQLSSLSGLNLLSVTPYGSVTIEGNNNLSCSQINSFTSQLDPTVNINTPDC